MQADLRDEKSYKDFASLPQVKEMLQQQKVMYSALVQQQQENFKGFVKTVLDPPTSRLDTIIREVQEIKTSIQFTQKKVDDMKTHNIEPTEHCTSMQAPCILKIRDSLLDVSDKIEYLESHYRRSNLVFDSVPEWPKETCVDTGGMIKNVLVDKLLLKKEIEIERVHRTGKPVICLERNCSQKMGEAHDRGEIVHLRQDKRRIHARVPKAT